MLHEPSHLFTGKPIDASGRHGLVVEDRILRVEAGSADLYLDRPGRAGSRRHLTSLQAGDIAVPLGEDTAGLQFLVFPGADAQFSALEPEAFRHALDAAQADAIEAVEAWIGRAFRACGTPLEGHLGLLGEGPGLIDPGFVLRPAEGLVWVAVTEGALSTALPGSGPVQAGDTPVPVVAATGGIVSDHGARVVGSGSARLAQEGGLSLAFAGYQARLARSLAASVAAADAAEAAFVVGKPARDRAALAATVEPLLAAHARGEPRDTTLTAAFRAVAEASAVTLPSGPPLLDESAPHDRQITALAAWAGVRPRRIRLSGGWWRRGGQPVLGVRKADGATVALIPGTGWQSGYRMWDGGVLRRVGEREAAALTEHGTVLQRRLPDGPINGRGLLRFVQPLALPILAAVLVVGLAGSALSLVMPMATEILFETVIPSSSRPELVQLAAGIAALGLGSVVFELVRSFLLLRLATLLNVDLEGAVWDRLLRLPAGFFRRYAAGDLAMRAAAVNQMRDAVGGTVINSLLSAVFSLSSLALILYYEWRLALVAIGFVTVQLVLMVLGPVVA